MFPQGLIKIGQGPGILVQVQVYPAPQDYRGDVIGFTQQEVIDVKQGFGELSAADPQFRPAEIQGVPSRLKPLSFSI